MLFSLDFVFPHTQESNKERKPGGENDLSLLVSRFWKKKIDGKVGEILNLE